MSPVSKEHYNKVHKIVHEVLGGRGSNLFLGRIDGILRNGVRANLLLLRPAKGSGKTSGCSLMRSCQGNRQQMCGYRHARVGRGQIA